MQEIIEQLESIKSDLEKLERIEKIVKNYESLEKKIGMSLFEFVDLHFKGDEKAILNGNEVSQKVIDEIKTYFIITKHALEKLKDRTNMVSYFENGTINFNKTVRNIKHKINHRLLAYYNTDSSINIAIDKYNYFVFEKDKKNNYYILVTFKEKSYNGNDIFYKRKLAEIGYDRIKNN